MNHGRITLRSVPKNAHIVIGSDAHYWPGKPTTAHRAFVEVIKELKPYATIYNGDVIDAANISRHPPIGWEKHPSVQEEIEVAQTRVDEAYEAHPKSLHIWTMGNHDARYETRLASVAPEYAGVRGVHLKDHFGQWTPAWSVEIGGKNGAIIKHRYKGGMHAAYNNALVSGRTTVTGHLHRLGVRPISDYSGIRWGVEGGMLADREGPQWAYTEDNPLDWQSGFIVLQYRDGRLMMPQMVLVVGNGQVEWLGKIHRV